MLAFYRLTLKFDKPYASTKYIVLWKALQVRNILMGLPLSCFAGFPIRSDGHVHPAGAGNVDGWWKLLKAYASGVLGKDIIIAI